MELPTYSFLKTTREAGLRVLSGRLAHWDLFPGGVTPYVYSAFNTATTVQGTRGK